MMAAIASRYLRNGLHFPRKHSITFGSFRGQLKICRALLYTKPTVPKRRLSKRWLVFGSGLSGAFAVLGFQLHQYRLEVARTGIPRVIIPTRSVKFPADTSGLKLTLYQYQGCPFCAKVSTYLNFKGISYDVVEVSPLSRSAISFSKWRKLPIVIVEEADGFLQLNDSSKIISCLQSYLMDKTQSISKLASYYPTETYKNEKGYTVTEVQNRYSIMYGTPEMGITKEELKLEKNWREWADTELIPIIDANVYRTPSEAMDALRWFSKVGDWENALPAWERYVLLYIGPFRLYFVGLKFKKKHDLKEDVRQSLYLAGQEWTTVIGQKPFMGGGKPNLADLAVYGILSSIEGCAAFKDLKENTKISDWYNRTKLQVESHFV